MPSSLKNILIIRHGQTEFNKKGIVQGSGIDAPLNEKGIAQALAFFDYYNHLKIDKIYTSTLIRTHQSVKCFIEKGIVWEQHQGLNEISWGTREGKLPDIEDNKQFNIITQKWADGHTNLRFAAGESPNEVAQRQQDFWNKMLKQTHEENILIAMHGRALKILLANVLNNNLAKMDKYEHSNLCLYWLAFDYHTESLNVVKFNDTTHLKSLEITQ